MEPFRRPLLAILLLGLALRLLFSLGYWVGKPLTADELEYLSLARHVAAGDGLVYDDDGHEHFGRAPGYPIFLAAIVSLSDSPRAIRAVQSLVGTIAVWLIALLAAGAAGPRAGLVAAAIAAVYAPLVWMPAYVLSEALFSTMILACVWLLGRALERSSLAAFALTGVAIGLTALVRPAALPFLAVLGLVLLLRGRVLPAAALGVGAALVVAPWAAWKTHQSGRPILIASEGGITFWTGNHPLAVGEGDMAANPAIKAANAALREAHPGLSPDALEPVYYQEAKEFIRREPLRWLSLLPRKLFYLWVPVGPSYAYHSGLYGTVNRGAYLLLLPFAVAGFFRLRQLRAPAMPLWVLAGSTVLTCVVFFPQDRYRVPAIDPVMIVCAATLASGARDED